MATVQQVIKNDIPIVSPSASVADIARKMRDHGVEVVAVCDNGKFRGIVSTESVISWVVESGRNPERDSAELIIKRDVPKVPLGTDIITAAKIMANHDVRYLPVVQHKKLHGILTLDALLKESPALAVIVMNKHSESKERKAYAFAG